MRRYFVREGTMVSGMKIVAGQEYIFEFRVEGGLLIHKSLQPIVTTSWMIIGVEKEYFEHGNGD